MLLGYENLVNDFLHFDIRQLSKNSDEISTKFEDGNIFPPYVPLIGKSYTDTKLLIYGMAQNLDGSEDFYKGEFTRKQLVERLKFGASQDMYKNMDIPFNEVLIEPYRVGILPALAGIYSHTILGMTFESLHQVHDHIAVSNYYKFSIHEGRKDINPNSLRSNYQARENYEEYFRTNDKLVGLELDVLKPVVILVFNGLHIERVKEWMQSGNHLIKILPINDPAWILRGNSGCLKLTGSWGKRLENYEFDSSTRQLVNNYLDQIKTAGFQNKYYQPRLKEIKIYLFCYAQKWVNDAKDAQVK